MVDEHHEPQTTLTFSQLEETATTFAGTRPEFSAGRARAAVFDHTVKLCTRRGAA